jgi:ribosomal protein L6P/L9E
MIKLLKKNIEIKNKIFLRSSLGNIQIFFIDKIIKIPKNIKIKINNQNIYFEGFLGKLVLNFTNETFFFLKKNQLILIINLQKNKKSILNLY